MGVVKFVVTEQLEVNGQQLDNLWSCFLQAFGRWLALRSSSFARHQCGFPLGFP